MLLLFAWVCASAEAQLFRPFTSFRVIQTEQFDIIFPPESESSARHLASFADRVYKELSSLLGISLPRRIPVTFAPHTGLFNAYYRSMPGSHIVLFDTPKDVEWTTFSNNLKGVFVHELAHAVSLSTRRPFFQSLYRIFGNWVRPTFINAPSFMVEGVAVSFESLPFDGSYGFGRANDPRTRQYIRQAIHEGKFPTPFQVSGMYDIPAHGTHYDYGGLFSAWLLQTFGMEKYAELWQTMGRRFGSFSFNVHRSGFYNLFERVYGIGFMDAWNAFGASLALDGLETNGNEILPQRYRFFSERNDFLRGLASSGDNLHFIDSGRNRGRNIVRTLNTQTWETSSFNAGFLLYDIDAAACGTALLLSGYRLLPSAGGLSSRILPVVSEYSINGRRTGRTIQGLYRGRYFRNGVIGLRSELHNNLIVFEDFYGNSRVLFRGNSELMFSGPQPVDEQRIAFIVSRRGIRELWLYNYVSGELFRFETPDIGMEYWNGVCWMRYARNLRVSEGKLFFSHNPNDRMFKLGMINLNTMEAVFSSRDFSGGVFQPVSLNGSIYYIGAFASGDRLLRFPETAALLSGKKSRVNLIPIDFQNYNTFSPPLYQGSSSRYFSLRHISPLQLWLPLPLIRTAGSGLDNFSSRLDGGGFFSMMSDPTDRNFITIIAYADIRYQMAMIDTLAWQNTSLGIPLTLSFFDRVVDHGNAPFRHTGGSLGSAFQWSMGQWIYGLSFRGSYSGIARYEAGKMAYQWERSTNNFSVSAGFFLSNRVVSLQLGGISFANNFQPRIDGVFRANTDTRFPLHLTLFGAYDRRGMDLHGVSNSYGAPLITGVALNEFAHPAGLSFYWLGGGELALGIFSFEIQRNLSHLYFNRLFGTLAIRNQIFDSQGHPAAEGIRINDLHLLQSLAFRLTAKTSFFPIVRLPVSIEPYFIGAWKFSNTITGNGAHWNARIGFRFLF